MLLTSFNFLHNIFVLSRWILTVLLILCKTGLIIPQAATHDIFISTNGTDNTQCWRQGSASPCKTLMYALQVVSNNLYRQNVAFHLGVGNYTLTNNDSLTVIRNANNISIIGESRLHVNIKCQEGAGLAFISSSNITLKSFLLRECGKLHDDNSSATVCSNSCYRSGLQFKYCTSIHLSQVTVVDSNGIGLDIINTGGENCIENSWFILNRVREDEMKIYPGGGGAAVRLDQDEQGRPIQKSRYDIHECFFGSNNATSGVYMYEHRTINITTGRYTNFIQGNGGGLGIFLQNEASNNHIVVNRCRSELNQARFGAGLMLKFADATYNNSVVVNSSVFIGNSGFGAKISPPGNEGGGVRVDFIQNVSTTDEQNTALFMNITFAKNWAYKGGGLSIAFSEVLSSIKQPSLTLSNCHFISNRAQGGSGLFASSFTELNSGYLPKVTIINSTFSDNVLEQLEGYSVSGFGCVYADKVPMKFSGDSFFRHNSGSALCISGTDVEVNPSSSVHFDSNTGHSGGAIALLNKGILTVNKRSNLSFFNNSAEIQGGAIFSFQSGFQEGPYSEFCFVRYKYRFVHPKMWDYTFVFQNNTAANKPNAIATPSILACVWPESINSSLGADINSTFCWDTWHYIGSNCTEQIETFAASYQVLPIGEPFHNFKVYPGRATQIPVIFYDDKGINNTYVLTAQISGNQTFVSRYVSDGNITIYGKEEDNVQLILRTLAPRVIRISLNVTFQLCPPGFEQTYLEKIDSYKCVCSRNYKQIVFCSEEEFSASIRLGYFMSYDDKKDEAFVFPWLIHYDFKFDPKLPGYMKLNDNKLKLNQETCKHLGRTGYMCEKCLPGRSVPVYNYNFECVHCSEQNARVNWFYFVLLELLPVTLLFLVIVAFNISITSGPVNGFILFAQIISNPVTVTRLSNQLQTILSGGHNSYIIIIAKAFLILPYSIWNLDFFSVILPPFCITRHQNFRAIHAYVLSYITAFYPLFLIVATYVFVQLHDHNFFLVRVLWKPFRWCFSKIGRKWELRTSLVDVFAGFLLLSYSKLCLVSFYLLVPMYGIKADGESQTDNPRLLFDTSVAYFGGEHIPFVALSLFVIGAFIVLPPVLLFVYPLKVFQQLLNKARVSGNAMRIFVESYQGCYNDGLYFGRRDCRWFASLYFVARILAFSSLVFSFDLLVQRLVEMVILIVLSVLFYIFRPYKDDYNNKVDVCIFGCLLISAAVGMYTAAVPRSSVVANILLAVSFLIPLLYMISYTGKNVWRRLRRYCKSLPAEYQPRLDPSALVQSEKLSHLDLMSSSGSSAFPDRLLNPDDYFSDNSKFTKSEVVVGSYGSTN